MNKIKVISGLLAAMLALSSCGLIKSVDTDDEKPSSQTTSAPQASSPSVSDPSGDQNTSGDQYGAETVPTTDAQTVEQAEPVATNTQPVEIDGFSSEYNEFLSQTVFVGDSICSGLRVYGILPDDNVMAVGNVGARSIFDYKFTAYGTEYSITDALKVLQPRYVICSMGMNDVNMGDENYFCDNYDTLLAAIREAVPNAKIFVASITPIDSQSSFCSNSRIDMFNQTLKSHLASTEYQYIDWASGMKDSSNGLASENNGGDGIHLSPAAYTEILRRACEIILG